MALERLGAGGLRESRRRKKLPYFWGRFRFTAELRRGSAGAL